MAEDEFLFFLNGQKKFSYSFLVALSLGGCKAKATCDSSDNASVSITKFRMSNILSKFEDADNVCSALVSMQSSYLAIILDGTI